MHDRRDEETLREVIRETFGDLARKWPALTETQRADFLLEMRPGWSAMFAGMRNLHIVLGELEQLIPEPALSVLLQQHDAWARGDWHDTPDTSPPARNN